MSFCKPRALGRVFVAVYHYKDFVPGSKNDALDNDFLNISADVPECVQHTKFHGAVNMVLKSILGIANEATCLEDSSHLVRATQLVNIVLKVGSAGQKEGASFLQSLVCFMEAKCVVHAGLTKAMAAYHKGCHADVVTWAEENAKEWSIVQSRLQALEQLAQQGEKHGLSQGQVVKAKEEIEAVSDIVSKSNTVLFTKAVEELAAVIAPHKSWRDTVTQTSTWETVKTAAAGLFDETFIKSLKKSFVQAHKVVR
eukprot:6475619-Amphidinium_carterae.4